MMSEPMKRSKYILTTFGALTWLAAVSASAAVESFSASYATAANPVDIGSADISPVQLQKFDTMLGTLNDVIITLSSADSLQTLVVNYGSSTAFQNAQTAATITVTGQDGTQSFASLSTTPYSGTIAPGSFASPQFNNSGPVAQQSNSGSSHVAPADFSSYETAGTGYFDYTLSAAVWATSSGQSAPYMFFGYKATSYGSVSVQYDYTPAVVAVPEAGTMLAGCFALGIGFVSVLRSRGVR
jgi:hypothetical protein